MTHTIYFLIIVAIGLLAFLIGKKLAPKAKTESKTTTFLIKSIQAIAELAVLEYTTEGIADIKEKKTSLVFARWKRGLLRYTARIKVGFEIDRLEHTFDHEQKNIRIIPLGGLGEVGRNMMCLEYDKEILVIDMGFRMPEEDMPGVDYIIPNIDYLKGKEKKI